MGIEILQPLWTTSSKILRGLCKNSASLCSEATFFVLKFDHFLLFGSGLTGKILGPSALPPSISKIFLCFLFSRLNNSSIHSLSLYDRFCSSLIMALCWASFSKSVSHFLGEPRSEPSTSNVSQWGSAEVKDHLLYTADSALPNAPKMFLSFATP